MGRVFLMEERIADYLRHLSLEKNASAYTVKSYREDLTQAMEFFRDRLGTSTPEAAQVTPRVLRAHLAWLHEQGYAKATISRRLAAVRSFLRFLCRQGELQSNPGDALKGPRHHRELPHFLSRADVEKLLDAPVALLPLGVRDRSILETLYSTGVRVGELSRSTSRMSTSKRALCW